MHPRFNHRLAVALVAVRVQGRDLSTLGEVRDALAQRAARRNRQMQPQELAAWRREVNRDLSTFGRVERTPQELARAVKCS